MWNKSLQTALTAVRMRLEHLRRTERLLLDCMEDALPFQPLRRIPCTSRVIV